MIPNYGCVGNAEVCHILPYNSSSCVCVCVSRPCLDTQHPCQIAIYLSSIYLTIHRYAGIFGLTGSVGGKAELAYLTKTYGALRFNVPRFLDTCVGTPRKVIGIDGRMDGWMDG